MPACGYCGQPVWWALTTGGKRMPIDPEPDGRGNLLLVHVDGTPFTAQQARAVARGAQTATGSGAVRVTVARRGARSMSTADPLPRWRSHWATCSKAEQVREDGSRRRRGTAR